MSTEPDPKQPGDNDPANPDAVLFAPWHVLHQGFEAAIPGLYVTVRFDPDTEVTVIHLGPPELQTSWDADGVADQQLIVTNPDRNDATIAAFAAGVALSIHRIFPDD